jgi:hypothetical protein
MKHLLVAFALLSIPVISAAQTVDPRIRVDSSYGAGPTIAFDAAGNAIVLFFTEDEKLIHGKRYDSALQPIGDPAEFVVSTPGEGGDFYPSVSTFSNGGFVAGWTRTAGGIPKDYIRRFDDTGAPIGSEAEVPLSNWGESPTVQGIATDPLGAFDVYWYYTNACGPGYCNLTYGAGYDGSGAYEGVNAYVGGTYADPAAIGCNASGSIVAAYRVYNGSKYEPGDYELRFRIGTVGANLGSEKLVKILDSTRGYDVGVSPSGQFVIVWADEVSDTKSICAQRYDVSGDAIGGVIEIYEATDAADYYPKVACNSDEGFLVAWRRDLRAYPSPRTGEIFAACVSPSNDVTDRLPITPASDIYAFNFDVAASTNGSYGVVYDNSVLVAYNTWKRVVWMSKVTPPIVPLAVHLDVLPGSCTNPLNLRAAGDAGDNPNKGGVLPVAVLGTSDFDVSDIDVASLRLEGVPPLRHAYEDVGAPSGDDDCECGDQVPDGYMDLTLKFRKSEIASALMAGEGEPRLHLSGSLLDGTPTEGSDCVQIKASSGPIATPAARGFELKGAVPNPFNPSTTIAYSTPKAGHVRLDIYDASGAVVATLIDANQPAGAHEVHWDGVDAAGHAVASGVYFSVLRTDERVVSRKMTLLK